MRGRSTARPADPPPLFRSQEEAWRRGECPSTTEVAPGVWAVAVPCSMFPVRFTYAYLVVDAADAVVIDPGLDSPAGVEALARGAAVAGVDLGELTGILVTHHHPDHLGMAARLRRRSGARVAVHEAEATVIAQLAERSASRDAERAWLAAVDASSDVVAQMEAQSRAMAAFLRAQVCRPDERLRDGDVVRIGARALHVVHTPGHTGGHVCLVDRQAALLFTGDHVLPTINPNVGLHATGRGADPIGDYLDALERLRAFDGCTVLPGHEYAFERLNERLDALVAHQSARRHALLDVLHERGASSVSDAAAALTWSRSWEDFGAGDRRLALATTYAHLRHLELRGLVAASASDPTRFGLIA